MTFDGKVQKMKEVKDVKGEPILENERVFSDIKKDSKRENREIGGEDEEEGRDLALWGHGQMAKKKTRASRPSRPKMGTPQSYV
jgi:hypothetical protein